MNILSCSKEATFPLLTVVVDVFDCLLSKVERLTKIFFFFLFLYFYFTSVVFSGSIALYLEVMRFFWLCVWIQLTLCQSNYEDIFCDILPKRLKPTTVALAAGTKLYANKYVDIKDLVQDLVGDPRAVNSFDFSKPFNYAYDDYNISANKSTSVLSEEIEMGLYTELLQIYQNFQKIYVILSEMTLGDFVAIYDHVYGETSPDEVITSLKSDNQEHDVLFGNMFEFNNGFEDDTQESFLPFVPFVDTHDIQNSNLLQNDDDDIQAQLLFSLIKIPLVIVKAILKAIWLLIELKKYIEYIETKIVLYIIKIIQKICKIIMRIKKKISRIIQDTNDLTIPYIIAKKFYATTLLIIKRLRILSWELQDILYRYKWRTIFLIKHAEKRFLLYAIFFKECIYGKLDKPDKSQMLEDFVNYDDDYYDWDDYEYFKEFAHYVYRPLYKTKDEEIKKVIERMEDEQETGDFDEDYDEIDDKNIKGYYHGDDLPFDLKEEFGFDTIKLTIRDDGAITVAKSKKLY